MKAPTAAWIQVSRMRGAPRPPITIAIAHRPTMNGSTSRSRCMSIGVDFDSSTELNGTSQSITMNPAIIHGSRRVVFGQSPPRAAARACSMRAAQARACCVRAGLQRGGAAVGGGHRCEPERRDARPARRQPAAAR